MAQSRSFFDDVKKELDCSVCQEQFSATKEPKILKCLHTFCRSCLEAWLARQREGKLSCPTCRQITECPNNDINSLPSNLFYKQLVDIVDAYSGGGQDDSPQCGNCEEKNYLKCYCSRCNCFLCEDCAGVHVKGKLFRGHQVKEIRNFQSSDVQDYARRANVCKKHDDEVRFFCVDCQICICRDCAILEHQDHKKISIDEGLVNSKSEIEAKMREVQTKDSSLRTHREALEKRRQKVSSDIDEATREVKRVAACCVLLIRKHEESVLQQLLEQKEALQDSFAVQISSLDGKLTEIESTVAFCEEVLLRKNLPEILNVKTIIEERLRDLSLSSPKDIPKQNYSRVKYVSNDFSFAPGRLITSNTEPSLSVAEGKGVTEGIVGEDCSFTVITKDSTSKVTYSEIDEVEVAITSVSPRHDVTEPVNMTLKDGRYTFSYRPTTPGEFTVAIKVAETPIMGSPFTLTVKSKPEPGHKIKNRNTLENSSAPEIPSFEIEPKIVIEDHIKENRPVLPAEDEGHDNHERIHKTVTDHTFSAPSHSPEIGSFEIEPNLLKVFVKARAKELDAIETKYKVEIPRFSKGNKFTLKARQGCNTEEYTEACNIFIDLYQEMHQLIRMERFCLKREEQVIRAREEISKMGKMFPVSVQLNKNHKEWELYGEASHIEEALEHLKQKGIEVTSEPKTKGNEKGTRKKKVWVNKYRKIWMDADESEHSRDDSSWADVTETYLAADNRHPLSPSGPLSYSGAVKGSADGTDKHPPPTHQPGGHEHKMGFNLPPAVSEHQTDSKKEKECPICLETISNPRYLKCKHVFCSACLQTALGVSNKCPICQEPQGVLPGNQPQGEMRNRVNRYQRLPGYEAYGTIIIDYRFPSGIQGREHPNPGQYYEGTYRAAYLPDNREGREVLQLLRKAFDARLVFTIGTSNTTGHENQITWNDIHHKTSTHGGPFAFGYPDPDYLRRVKEELAAKGIR